jgi:hypothetical protein
MLMTKKNRLTTQAADGRIIAGIKKDLQTVSSLPLGGDTYTPTSLVAFIQSRIDAANAVAIAKANWLSAVATYEALDTKGTVVVHDLKQYVMGAFGKTSPQLADFGFSAPKTATQTPEEKAAAVVKRAATRKARGTMGPKAKLAVTGETAAAKPAAPLTPVPVAATPVPVTATPPTPIPGTAATAVPVAAATLAPVPAPAPVAPSAALPAKQ